jgi:hypothetical protein
MKTVMSAMENLRVLVLTASGEDMKYVFATPRIMEPRQKERDVLRVRL